MTADNVNGDLDSAPGVYGIEEDTEEFCPDCLAGMESSEHHEKCVRPAEQVEFWLESNDEDELRAGCDCGWRSEWRDLIRNAVRDGDDHLTSHTPGGGRS